MDRLHRSFSTSGRLRLLVLVEESEVVIEDRRPDVEGEVQFDCLNEEI